MSLRWHQTWKMYDRIPMKSKSILPDEGFDARLVECNSAGQMYMVYCKSKGPKLPYRKVRHRVMVICDCGRHIPFGRMHQHYDVQKCSGGE